MARTPKIPTPPDTTSPNGKLRADLLALFESGVKIAKSDIDPEYCNDILSKIVGKIDAAMEETLSD